MDLSKIFDVIYALVDAVLNLLGMAGENFEGLDIKGAIEKFQTVLNNAKDALPEEKKD